MSENRFPLFGKCSSLATLLAASLILSAPAGRALAEPPAGAGEPTDAAAASGEAEAPKPKPKPKPRPKPKPKPKPPAPPPPPPPVAMQPAAAPPANLAPAIPASFTDWRDPDPENTLVIDTSKGRMLVELRPEVAPAAVARVKMLARARVYDGLLFHRVIAGFVAQTGNPNNKDGGATDNPNLAPEFTFRLGVDTPHVVVQRPVGASYGFIGVLPYGSADEGRMAASPDRRLAAWGLYCQGVAGMGRQSDVNSANSEIFFMLAPAHRLERDYTPFGRLISGYDVLARLNQGEPPAEPDRMAKARVLADIPGPERPHVRVLNTQGAEFQALVAHMRALRGADFSPCDLEIPTSGS